ncbi:hypothetical protein JXB28_01935 [Candidatus Woesearchaeota archaeon]|nr:hypothetical protein [Candidatus Woesearchaeota archaeon]
MVLKKSDKDLASELSDLKKRADKLEKELERLEKLEKGLAQQEIVLAKKITDMNKIEESMSDVVSRKEFDELKKELKKLESHEVLLAENSKFIREIANEVGMIKETDISGKGQPISSSHKPRHSEIADVKKELHHRLSDIEHQNKLIMSYLKRVDEVLQMKLGI